MTRFSGRTVVVTGGAGGLGQAFARAWGRGGAHVALLDLNADALDRAVTSLAAVGITASAHVTDVTQFDACVRTMDAIVAATGGVDVLVNNAGISHHSRFADTDPQVLARLMNVNFFGAVHCTKAALPSLQERRGSVVAVSSVAGFAPLLERCGYAASKHALHGFFDTLRAELAPDGVSVTLVCPSYVDTGIDANALAGDGGRVAAPKKVVGKKLSPDDVANATVAAVAQRKDRLLLSPVATASWWLSRVAPSLYARAMVATHHRS